ncbi:MAG: hypothetical protein PVF54_09745, partial [Anaerolineae bacterium]
PSATPYLWTKIPGTLADGVPSGWTSERFARMLLERTAIAVAPGPFFGHAGEGFVRVSASAPTGRIREAKDRLRAFEVARVHSGSSGPRSPSGAACTGAT